MTRKCNALKLRYIYDASFLYTGIGHGLHGPEQRDPRHCSKRQRSREGLNQNFLYKVNCVLFLHHAMSSEWSIDILTQGRVR